MIPARPFLAALGVFALLGVLPFWLPAVAQVWQLAISGFLLLALLDTLLIRNAPLRVQRESRPSMSLDSWSTVVLTLDNTANRVPLSISLYDHHPEHFLAEGLPLDLVVPAGKTARAEYRVRPVERGLASFTNCDLRIRSRLGFWWHRRRVLLPAEVRVYPNYSTISQLLAYEVDSNLQLAGLRLRQRRGEGIEFHQLRDYRQGDAIRSIDWKATARVGRLITREYQDERDQQVVFLLDTGRRMQAKDANLSHFDHSLNAMLLLSYIALRHGDAAGVMTMGSERSFLPPRKGADAVNGILNHVYDIQPERIEVDYISAATDLAVRQRRRSLIVMLTNVREEDTDELLRAVRLLSQKHLVMIASLRERALDDTLAAPIRNHTDALTYAATQQYMDSRRETHQLLSASGVHFEDCLSNELPAAITNRYLAIKRAGLL
ncbi:MAG: DUF58 domain-containing protein [Pseudomonadota bacterium]